ncbi:uncharacterized protein K460DRAFT_410622 [Cucurbitaria berberidis CBS 394.84]|uniref:Uncharacterized protein n=1 Tax=Cucurbitaria berberidis CBS 394.84 TaxID=1168544 RepID=A0A9P4G8U0_9PLEO|nr:uncharacterized protein K460DRAFT_410622 [Cucurbitaria berberidis CBS 394.84]KAF1841233.1 hypothetical protein K460DRAFT_410622 [Cucurbitaria berberidis CBS 394.84]
MEKQGGKKNEAAVGPVRSLTFKTPELRKFLHDICLKYDHDFNKWYDGDFKKHPYSIFLSRNGYMLGSAPHAASMLSNPIHPIFAPDNWYGPYNYPLFLSIAWPALQLASLWISHDSWLFDWWVHLYYGQPQVDRKGRIYLGPNPREGCLDCRSMVAKEMRKLAGQINFVILPPKLLRGALASSNRSTRTFIKNLMREETSASASFFEAFPCAKKPVIALSSDFYHIALAGTSGGNSSITGAKKLQHHFGMAHTLVHELAHALVSIWHPWTSMKIEPLHRLDDLPEAGKSWEDYVFGAELITLHGASPMMCREWDHSLPLMTNSRNISPLPLSSAVPESWTNTWFLPQTWENMYMLRGALKAPSIRQGAPVIAASRVIGNKEVLVLYYHGVDVMGDDELAVYHARYLEGQLQSQSSGHQLSSTAAFSVGTQQQIRLIHATANLWAVQTLSFAHINNSAGPSLIPVAHASSSQSPPRLVRPPPLPNPETFCSKYLQIWRNESVISFNAGNSSSLRLHHAHPYMHLTLPRCRCNGCMSVMQSMIDAENGTASPETKRGLEEMELGSRFGEIFYGNLSKWRARGGVGDVRHGFLDGNGSG